MRAAAAVAWLGLLAVAGCVRAPSPSEPTAPGVSPRPTVACPAPVVSQSLTGQPVRVDFPPPQAAGGLLPLSVGCTPRSGAPFSIGTTTVVCTVTDATQEAFTCNFTVRVLGPPRLSATR